jgi:hypothetical protein
MSSDPSGIKKCLLEQFSEQARLGFISFWEFLQTEI